MPAQPAPRRYETSIDRVGLAIGAGGLMGGAIGVLLMVFAGTHSIGALAVALLVGSLMTALSITALAAYPGRCSTPPGAAARRRRVAGRGDRLRAVPRRPDLWLWHLRRARDGCADVALPLGERVAHQPGDGGDGGRDRRRDVARGVPKVG